MSWTPEIHEIAYSSGPKAVAGYTYRGLGISIAIRPSPKGRHPPVWNLTHLGTGHQVVQLTGFVAVVFPVATQIAESGDWDFLSLFGWKNHFPDVLDRLREIIEKYPKVAGTRECNGSSSMSKEDSHAIAQQIAANRP